MNARIILQQKYASLTPRQKQITHVSIALIGLFVIILFKWLHGIATSKHPTHVEPVLVRQGDNIIIPQHSLLREQMTVKTVHVLNQPHNVTFPGIIEADPKLTVNVLPPLTGRLASLEVGLGEFVKKNQLLAIIRSPDLAQAFADNDKAKSVLMLSKNAFKRAQDVNRVGGNSVKDVQMAQSDYLQAQAEADRTAVRLKILGQNEFGRLAIKAPADGWITAINYGVGSYITDPTSTLLSISNLSTVWVTASIPEDLAGFVKKNLPVQVTMPAYPGLVLKGVVTFVSSYLDPITRQNNTRIAFQNRDGKLQPNMFANVSILLPEANVVMIPITSILMNDDTTSVYAEIQPWVFKRREVQLGLDEGNQVRVLAGLNAGERIAVEGGIFIND